MVAPPSHGRPIRETARLDCQASDLGEGTTTGRTGVAAGESITLRREANAQDRREGAGGVFPESERA